MATSGKRLTSLQLAKVMARLAHDKKAVEITVLDMRKVANFCDFFVLCNGTSDRHIRAVAQGISDGLEEQGERVSSRAGFKDAHWVVLDAGDVIAHVFDEEAREFYGLDHLWQEAKQVKWQA